MRFIVPAFLRAPSREVSSHGPVRHTRLTAATNLTSPEPQVTPRFKRSRTASPSIEAILTLVPGIITDPAQRMLAATLPLQEARYANRIAGTTPEGLIRAYFEKLEELVATQDSMGEVSLREFP